MSEINPASGFTIEFGAAMTSLVASKLGLPISTTHCLVNGIVHRNENFRIPFQVGSVVAVGALRSEDGVKWSTFRNIFMSWVITLPVSGKK